MGGILEKRLLRDLRQNAGRYFALTMLIVLGVFLVFSIVGAAEVVLGGTELQKSVNQAQDGSFTVFLELNDDELDTLTDSRRPALFRDNQSGCRKECGGVH